jgi:hypothetical protein
MSCYSTSNITGINYYTSTGRFTDKSNNSNERDNLFKVWWKDQIAQYGTSTTYFVRDFTLSAADKFYGENTVSGFKSGTTLVMVMNLSDNSITFSKFGLTSDDEVEAYIDISTYQSTLSSSYVSGEVIEPKAGDVFQLTEFGDDRPGGRDGKYFEITERVDESINTINPLQGHYLYKIKARRFDFSYTDNDVEEGASEQITDDALSGKTTDTIQDYINDLDTEQATYFNYGANDDVYGDYS